MKKYRLLGGKLNRYRHISNIIAKHGFGIILDKSQLTKILKIHTRRQREIAGLPPAVRIRKMLEELGPTFIKMGQILSTRPDLIPLPYIRELEKLQDNTPIISSEEIQAVFQEDTGKSISEIFESFDDIPFASASVSQVHKALYKGQDVAVKIQKPGIREQMEIDLLILYDLADLIEKFIKEASLYQPKNIVREFERSVKKELNFSFEARNIERFRKNFEGYDDICVPIIYRELTTRRVLTLEYMEGMIKINNVDEIEKRGLDRKKIAEIGCNAFMKQIFEDGFFHGDPHPANLFILQDGKICFIDFGITGRIREERRIELISLFTGFIKADSGRITESLEMMGALKEDIDKESFSSEIDDMLELYRDLPIKEIKINDIIEESFDIMRKYGLRIPPDFALLAKTLLTIEGIGTTLTPDFNLAEDIKPFMLAFMAKKARMQNLFGEVEKTGKTLYRITKEIPEGLESFFKMLKKGYINIAFEHKGLTDLISTIEKASNRVSFSLIISSLVIASSLIIFSGKGPYIAGHSALGIIGYLLSAILGGWLIIGIMKNRRL